MKAAIIGGLVAGLVGGLVVLGGMKLQQRRHGELQQAETQRVAQATAVAHQKACQINLLMIESATAQWALENKKQDDAIPTPADLNRYLPGGWPKCPDGGGYTTTGAASHPCCSIESHHSAR